MHRTWVVTPINGPSGGGHRRERRHLRECRVCDAAPQSARLHRSWIHRLLWHVRDYCVKRARSGQDTQAASLQTGQNGIVDRGRGRSSGPAVLRCKRRSACAAAGARQRGTAESMSRPASPKLAPGLEPGTASVLSQVQRLQGVGASLLQARRVRKHSLPWLGWEGQWVAAGARQRAG